MKNKAEIFAKQDELRTLEPSTQLGLVVCAAVRSALLWATLEPNDGPDPVATVQRFDLPTNIAETLTGFFRRH